MTTIYSKAALGLTGLLAAFCNLSTLRGAEPGVGTAPAALAAASQGTPAIEFETNFFDFGKITAPGELSGVFKFKNVGKGTLKVDPPLPSCGCTDAKAKPDTLAPGESGVITYTIKLDHALDGQKTIKVHSNDPKTPDVQLTMHMNYKPLYEVNPKALQIAVPAGKEAAEGKFMVFRTDSQPLQLDGVTASQSWVSAAFDPSRNPLESSAQVNVTVHRPAGASSVMSAIIQLWSTNQSARPMQTVLLMSDMQGELAAVPSRMYWVIPDLGNEKTNYPAEALTRKIELKSVLGNSVQIKKATSNIKGLSVDVVSKEGGRLFDLMLTFHELPQEFANGTVTVETSLASLPKLEVPLTVAVASGK